MKSIFTISGVLAAAMALTLEILADANLPKVTLMGKTFYYYEAESKESMAGIANKFGWSLDTLMMVNKDVVTPLDKGTLLYYPVSSRKKAKQGSETSMEWNINQDPAASPEVLSRIVPEGSGEGSGAGKDPGMDSGKDSGIIYYKVEGGDSLYGIAKKFSTTIEDIYRVNPGLSYSGPHAGETIKIKSGSLDAKTHVEKAVEKRVVELSPYKVRRGDTWESVAERKEVSVALLREANPGILKLKKGETIGIPRLGDVEVEKKYVEEDPREKTPEGRQELYNQVHDLESVPESGLSELAEVNVMIVLADPASNKDLEFARGAIYAADRLKTRPFRTRLNIIEGTCSIDSLAMQLDNFKPNVILSTSEKLTPSDIASYAQKYNVELVNVFDVKDEGYVENPYIIQYLAPSSYFNNDVAKYFSANYGGSNLIICGDMERSDTLGESILQAVANDQLENVENLSMEELPEMEYTAGEPLLIYGCASRREDVKNLLEKVSVFKERNPMAEIKVIGRPSWITFSDHLKDLFGLTYVLMPTRFYFDADDIASRNFIDGYKDMFGHTPIKSYPVYSATSYDILSYFVPNIAAANGDFNRKFTYEPTLQSVIDLKRVSNWGGIVNPGAYIVEFTPFGMTRKITLPIEQPGESIGE